MDESKRKLGEDHLQANFYISPPPLKIRLRGGWRITGGGYKNTAAGGFKLDPHLKNAFWAVMGEGGGFVYFSLDHCSRICKRIQKSVVGGFMSSVAVGCYVSTHKE